MSEHRMRVLITGVDAEGRSCVVGEEWTELSDSDTPGFWIGGVFETGSSPPTRPAGRGHLLDTGVEPGRVGWHVVDYGPGESYPMHHTDTIDLDLVVSGELHLTLDDGTHLLRAGEGVVMNGVDHAWQAGPDGARLSVVFIGTPPRADGS